MAKKNNVIEEIQELVQYIKSEYQEGVDFKTNYRGKFEEGKKECGSIEILSPRLRKFFREKINFPLGSQNIHHLDYHKRDQWGNNYYYRIKDIGENDTLYWQWNRKSELDEPKKCGFCSELTFQENGRMWLWKGKTVGKEFGQDSKIIGYFHPECAKKYFAGKEQSNENNTRIKEKLLRNLDKISFDQAGHLANAELLKNPNYEYGTTKKREAGVYQIKIEDEEINLSKFDREENVKDYLEIRNSIVNNIKQNISDWEIKNDEYNNDFLENKKNGVKVWKIIFEELVFENGKKEWAEIEALLKNNEIDREQIKQYFQKNNIKKIKLVNGELEIEYNSQDERIISPTEIDNGKFLQTIKNYSRKYNKEEINWNELNANSNNGSTNTNDTKPSPFENKYLWLVGGITVGILISGLLVLSLRRKKRKIN